MPREVTRAAKRERRPVRKAPSPSPVRPPAPQGVSELLLDLQRTAGNQAVSRLLDQYAAPKAKSPARPAGSALQISRRTPGFGTNPHAVDAPGDVPGGPSSPSPQVGAVTELRIDGDGDQQKELLLRITMESTWGVWSEAKHASVTRPKKIGVEVVQISSQAAQKVDFLLEGMGDFFPLIAAVTDGKAPTVISLTKPSTGEQGLIPGDRLLIYPPTQGANGREYRAEATGQSAAILLPTEAAPGEPIASADSVNTVSGMGIVADMSAVDISLGAYGDRFRVVVLPTAPDKARLNLYAPGSERPEAGDGVDIALSGSFSLRVVDTGPVSLGLDLNGDGKAEIQIYDQLDSPKTALGDSAPGIERNHRVRLTGPALSADAIFPFTVRAGDVKGGMSSIGGITALDIALGAFGDQFRLTFRPTGPESAHFGISPLRDGKPAPGSGLEIKLTGPLSVQAIDAGPTGLGLDLNGDGKAEILIADLLGSAADTQGFTVDKAASPGLAGHDFAAYRFHDLHLSGPAIGGESFFRFELAYYNGGHDPAASANAQAVDTLAKQAKEGDIQQRLDAADAAMSAIRSRAAKAGIIRQEVFDAWSALSVDLIMIEPRILSVADVWAAVAKGSDELLRQIKLHTVPPELQNAAAAHAAAFIQALTGAKDAKDDTSVMSWFLPDLAESIKSGEWGSVFREYQMLVESLDEQIADGLAKKAEEREENWRPEDGSETPEADDLEQVKQIGAQKKALRDLGEHNAKRLLAAFYPDDQFSDYQGYVSEVPLSLYYWKEEGANGNTLWYLKDITNPEKEHHYGPVASDENEKGPPADLLKKLNDPDRFPMGRIIYQIPDGGGGELAVTDHLTWKKFWAEVLKWLMVASVVLDPFEIAILPVLMRTAMFISAAGNLLQNYDQGDFDAGTALVDILQIVSALAGTSAQALAKIETEGAVFARMALQRVDAAANVTLFATFTLDTAKQLDAIEQGPGTREEKNRAKRRLLATFAATGVLTAFSIKGMPSEPGGGRTIKIRPSEAGRPATAEIVGEEAATGPAGSRAPGAKDEATQVDAKSPFADEPTQADTLDQLPEGSAVQGPTPRATRRIYENSMHSDPHREAQLVRNVDTGEIMVIQGEEGQVQVDAKVWKEVGRPGRWVVDRHIHPADATSKVTPFHDYFPSSTRGDLSGLEAESKMLGDQPRVSRIDLTTPHGPDYTEIGFNPRAKKPYTVEYPDPVTGKRTLKGFKTREAYEEWYSEQFPGRRADIDPAPAAGTHPSAPSGSGTPGSGGQTVQIVHLDSTPMASAGWKGSVAGAGGGQGVFRGRVATAAGEHDAALKLFLPSRQAYVTNEIEGARAAEATGYGPKVYGAVEVPADPATGAPRRIGFAMSVQEGGMFDPQSPNDPANVAEARANADRINDRTLADLDDYAKKLLAGGHYYVGDLQGFIGPHGEYLPIDFGTIKPLPPKGTPEYAAALKRHWADVLIERDKIKAILADNKKRGLVP